MKLYYMSGACPLVSHIVLEWIGAPYEIEEVTHDQMKSAEYLKFNPGGLVPALVDGDTTLTESVAILHYLAELHPQAQLDGDGTPRGRAEVNRWLGFINSDVHQTFKPIFFGDRYVADKTQHADLAAHARDSLRGLFALLDARLADHDWLGGAQRSIADPYLYVVMRWAKGTDVNLEGFTHLESFFQRMDADAGVKAALLAEA